MNFEDNSNKGRGVISPENMDQKERQSACQDQQKQKDLKEKMGLNDGIRAIGGA